MKLIKNCFLVILFFYVKNQVPQDRAINSCGSIGYKMPTDKNECIQPNEFCCFVHLQSKTNSSQVKRFCASAPNKILQSDVEYEIYQYTDYELVELSCNFSKILSIDILFLLLFILFYM